MSCRRLSARPTRQALTSDAIGRMSSAKGHKAPTTRVRSSQYAGPCAHRTTRQKARPPPCCAHRTGDLRGRSEKAAVDGVRSPHRNASMTCDAPNVPSPATRGLIDRRSRRAPLAEGLVGAPDVPIWRDADVGCSGVMSARSVRSAAALSNALADARADQSFPLAHEDARGRGGSLTSR
jgi:hypothetical protein